MAINLRTPMLNLLHSKRPYNYKRSLLFCQERLQIQTFETQLNPNPARAEGDADSSGL